MTDGEAVADAAGGTTEPATGTGGRVAALRGAVGFLTRLPVGRDATAWAAFGRTPAAFVPVGYLVGALVAPVLVLPVGEPTTALLFPVALALVTGINHADGVADLGDAAVVHGDPEARRAALKDSAVGVGGTLALTLLVAGLALAGLALASLPLRAAVGIVVAAEVSAKLGMATLSCLGTAPFEGLGSQLTGPAEPTDLVVPAVLALPAAVLTWPSAAATGALLAGVAGALATWRWATATLGGVNGDALGAANELARVAALHVGVVAWTLW